MNPSKIFKTADPVLDLAKQVLETSTLSVIIKKFKEFTDISRQFRLLVTGCHRDRSIW